MEVKLSHSEFIRWFLARASATWSPPPRATARRPPRSRDRQGQGSRRNEKPKAKARQAKKPKPRRTARRKPQAKTNIRAAGRPARSSISSSTRRWRSSGPRSTSRRPRRLDDRPMPAPASTAIRRPRSRQLDPSGHRDDVRRDGRGGPRRSAAAAHRRAADSFERRGLAGRSAPALWRRRARDRVAGARPPDPADDRRSPAPGGRLARRPGRRRRGDAARAWSAPWSSD